MIVASVIMAAVVYILHPVLLVDVLLAIVTGFVIYAALIIVLGVIKRDEITFIKSMVA